MGLFKFGLAGAGLTSTSGNIRFALEENRGERVFDSSWDMLWITTKSLPVAAYDALSDSKIVNQIPNLNALYSKSELARYVRNHNRSATRRICHPETWDLGGHRDVIEKKIRAHPPGSWLLKPKYGAKGRDIKLIRSLDDLPTGQDWLVQRYVGNPLLIDGSKTKLRVYLLITRLLPLQAWLYSDAFLTIAAEPYTTEEEALSSEYVHIIAAANQRDHPNFNETRCIRRFSDWSSESPAAPCDLWYRVKTLLIDTLEAVKPALANIQQTLVKDKHCCFELYGVDILFDADGAPWLIEFNRSPAMFSRSLGDMNRLMLQAAVQKVLREFFNLDGVTPDSVHQFESLVAEV